MNFLKNNGLMLHARKRIPSSLVIIAAIIFPAVALAKKPTRHWSHYVVECANTLIDHGRDTYGQKTPLIMAVIDSRTMTSPEKPAVYDSLIRLEGRIHRRGERGANLWNDQSLLRAMYRLSKTSGDAKYAQAADAYIDYYTNHCVTAKGLFVWGSHIHWDCYRERPNSDGPHEILINHAQWEDMYRVNPRAVRREIDAIWRWHVHDKESGCFNRHSDGRPGREFSFTGGPFTLANAFMYKATGEKKYLDRAKIIAGWHWHNRNPQTDLTSELPSLAADVNGLYGRASMTSINGPHASNLLRAYEICGEKLFLDVAVAYLEAFNKYGWDEDSQDYIVMLNLDGTHTTREDVPEAMRSSLLGGQSEPDPGYSVPPLGHADVWQTTIYPLDYSLIAAQAAIYAYELTKKAGKPREALLRSARRWAKVIEKNLPPKTGKPFPKAMARALPRLKETGGTYAENYGRTISFFVHVHRATGDKKYLTLAEKVAATAIEKLFVENEVTLANDTKKTCGIFLGHPAKPYYEAVDGVGILLYSLLELDSPGTDLGGAF